MDQSQLITNIREDLVLKNYCLPDSEFKPAWKFALYNPAKKDKEGAVVVRHAPVYQLMAVYMTICLTLIILGSGNYKYLLIPLLLFAANAGYTMFFYKPVFISISETGIVFKGQTYSWDNFTGAYITATIKGRSSISPGLVLIQQNGAYVYLDLSAIRKFNRIGTAIRDFQPASWKNSN